MIKIKFLLIKTKFYPLYCLYSIKIKNQIFNVFFSASTICMGNLIKLHVLA
ncbi:hypothetical protein [Phthorimaea operculella granulovirus]|uniref:Uncharacterized protein n=1 Tax=Phthorimaea operculella granulovirus TaxID=192584 RepID=Q8JRW9_9BBAC|nr:hypothetical protein [Phthorimaea operculella granulovirus]AAM70288.1 unknown [Phthorimaea operculella granulovirus]QBH65925.1 hypothetical protein PhopGVgp090 [Phthorimaea operculella granulovirus]QBH66055.1 hypothetical protein PhopGVgp090 [Phthorimaea operculella granulovirus]QBH66185.1 hypothetical protein PhopGVgp090 [Phthorimaea operculella granulovirus]QBH66315.1 hypothetical protein PhopGVgp090 [Phthorimaea operculella granulovirus]